VELVWSCRPNDNGQDWSKYYMSGKPISRRLAGRPKIKGENDIKEYLTINENS